MNVASPIVVHLGKVHKEHIGELRGGAGPVVEDIEEVMQLVRRSTDLEGEKRIFLPVVVVYERA
jgi:hypothetical protein